MQALVVSSAEITAWIGQLFWPFVRISAMFAIVPVLGSRLVPVRVRICLAMLISGLMAPVLKAMPVVEVLSATGLLISFEQFMIGLMMGLSLQLVFTAAMLTGEYLAMTMGLGFAQLNDPQNGFQTPVLSQFLVVVGTLVFISLDGHLTFLRVVKESFEILPITPLAFDWSGSWGLVQGAGQLFASALWLALPAVTAMLAVNLVLALVSRSAPQLNLFSVGFPITLWAGLIILLLVLPAFIPAFMRLLDMAYEDIPRHLASGG